MREALITVRQPFASAIFLCGKGVENRSWPTNYRGRLWIHAASKWYTGPIDGRVRRLLGRLHRDRTLTRGCIIGHVELVDVIAPERKRTLGDVKRYDPNGWAARGAYHWLLAEPVLLDSPIPWAGRQSLTLIDPASFLGAPVGR